MRKIFPLVLLCAIGNVTHAELSDFLPQAKIKTENVSALNLGVGITQRLGHVNAEWVNPYGIAYGKVGAFINDDHEIGGQIGFRYPVALNGKDLNGFYLGAFAGHLKSKSVNGNDETQLGGGVDLSYVLLNKERISTLSVGLAAGEEVKVGNHVVFETKPQIQFAYTLSVGF